MKTSCCQRLRSFCCYCSKSSTDYTTQALRLTLYQASKAVCRADVNLSRSIVCHNERLVAPIYEIADSEGPAIYLLPGGTYENVYCWQVGQSKLGEPGRVVATAHAALLQLWTLNAPGASICGHKTWRPRYLTYAKKIMAWHHLSAYLNWDPCKSMLTGIREMILLLEKSHDKPVLLAVHCKICITLISGLSWDEGWWHAQWDTEISLNATVLFRRLELSQIVKQHLQSLTGIAHSVWWARALFARIAFLLRGEQRYSGTSWTG